MLDGYLKDLFPFRFVVLVALGIGTVLLIAGCKSTAPGSLGIPEGKLSGCPASPNCVSTESIGDKHAIAPLSFTSSPGDAFDCLKRIIGGMKRTTMVQAEANYIHAEFRTTLGFVDDAEFVVDEGNRTIQMRSASRLGYWDFGVNRRRLEEIRVRFAHECTKKDFGI